MKRPLANINTVHETQDAVRKQPELHRVTFKVRGKAADGLSLASQTALPIQNSQADNAREGRFSIISDEPGALLGTDTDVSPAEYTLQALAGCPTVTLASMAATKKIDLSRLDLDPGFEIDPNGVFCLNKSVGNGAQAINADIKIGSDSATRAQFEDLARELPNHSPSHDTLENSIK